MNSVSEPAQSVKKALNYLDTKNSCALDIGCGVGRNAIYLSQNNFLRIDAIDFDSSRIEKLKEYSSKYDPRINPIWADIRKFTYPSGEYDLIISIANLYFLDNLNEINNVIDNMKSNTRIKGINVINCYVEEDGSFSYPKSIKTPVPKGFILNKYQGDKNWEIISYSEEEKFHNEQKSIVASVIARRVK